MKELIQIILVTLFTTIAAFHFYWGLGKGKNGMEKTLPQKESGAFLFYTKWMECFISDKVFHF